MNNIETQRLLQTKAAVHQTINTPGWNIIKHIWNNVVQAAIQDSLDEDDPTKAEGKRQRARALQKGVQDLFVAIDMSQKVLVDESEPDWFGRLQFEDAFRDNAGAETPEVL